MAKEKILYSKEQYDKDEKSIRDTEEGKKPLDLAAFKRLMITELCSKTDVLKDNRVGLYTVDQIEKALANPSLYNKVLIDTSKYLMGVSSFYMRMNKYFGTMGLFNYRIDTYDVKADKGAD